MDETKPIGRNRDKRIMPSTVPRTMPMPMELVVNVKVVSAPRSSSGIEPRISSQSRTIAPLAKMKRGPRLEPLLR